jgi:hypothetical protein
MRTVIAIGLVLWATGAEAKYMVLGQGALSCGAWQQERRTSRVGALAAETWVLGYLTRANYDEQRDLTAGTDAEGIYAWIDNYCRANPLKDLAWAAEFLVVELRKKRR